MIPHTMKHLLLLVIALLMIQSSHAQVKRGRLPNAAARAHTSHTGTDAARGNAPANDDCANAEAITVTADCSAPTIGNNADATNDGPDAGCDDPGADLLDVWYTFNSGAEDTIALRMSPGAGIGDWAFVLYDGCGGAELNCTIHPIEPVNVPVTPGTDYWLRIYSNPTYGVGGGFAICVTAPAGAFPPPTNDECSGAVPQAVAVGSTVTFQGDNTGATDTEGLGLASAWEAFTLPDSADITIDFCGTTQVMVSLFIQLYTTCAQVDPIYAGSYDSTACPVSSWSLCFPHLSAGTYFYPVRSDAVSAGPYVLNVTAAPWGTNAASNDECAGAIPLTAYTWCSAQTFSNGCASQSLPAAECTPGYVGYANDDVWYSFTATTPDMTIGGIPNGAMDIAMELFSGTCGSLTSIDCADILGSGGTDTLGTSGLTVGNTYYLRVFDFRVRYAFLDPTYQLCLIEGTNFNLGMGDADAASVPALFPNPGNGDFHVSVDPRSTSVSITIIDATGRMVLARNERNTTGSVQVLAAGKLSPGLYTVRVGGGSNTSEARLVIQ